MLIFTVQPLQVHAPVGLKMRILTLMWLLKWTLT